MNPTLTESRLRWLVTAPFATKRARLRAIWHFWIRRYEYEICMECGRPVSLGTGPTWWTAPDWMWERINGGPNGVLCMACFARGCVRAGYHLHWIVGGPEDEQAGYTTLLPPIHHETWPKGTGPNGF